MHERVGSHCVGSWQQDVAEFYSQPRLLLEASRYGLHGCISLDLLTGWDFRIRDHQDFSIEILREFKPVFLMASPPCKAFSSIMYLWNYKKMSAEARAHVWETGMTFLEHAMRACSFQLVRGQYFAFEHPFRATSWQQECVMSLRNRPGVQEVVFDQCMCGLVSKVTRTPMKKRTRILTNCGAVVRIFASFQCDRTHEHVRIQGEEGGMKRSVWAQQYPPPMVRALLEAAREVC